MYNKIGVIGDRDSVLGFKALGLDVFTAHTGEETARTIHELARSEFAVIFITEEAAQSARDAIARYTSRPFPAIIPIPGTQGSSGAGMAAIRESVERAIGTDILFRDE